MLTCLFLTDWLFGPVMVEDDSEEGRVGADEKWCHLTEKDEMKMAEKDGVLPGSRGPSVHPSSSVPLRSAIASSHPGGKRISTHSVTFICPQGPQITSLWASPQRYRLCNHHVKQLYSFCFWHYCLLSLIIKTFVDRKPTLSYSKHSSSNMHVNSS